MNTRRLLWLVVGLALLAGMLVQPAAIRAQAPPLADSGALAGSLPRQGNTYDWEEYGVTFQLPEGWQAVPGNGQDYHLALASPEAFSGGSGSFMTIRHIAGLGPGTTLESALQQVADQVKGEVAPYTAGDLEGYEVSFTDEQTSSTHHLILLPYGDDGEVLYFQTNAVGDEDQAVQDILSQMTINPPTPDVEAINAAWQSSLADDQTLRYGAADAPVTMLEYLDFSCSHCAEYHYDVGRLLALDADPGNLRVEFKLLDIIGGELSNAAAEATYCATEQGKGYSVYQTLFQGYMSEGRDTAYSSDGIAALLGTDEPGLDMDALNACIEAGTYADLITANNQAAEADGVNSTPSVLLAKGDEKPAFLMLNGEHFAGGVPVDLLREVAKQATEQDLALQDAFDQIVQQ